MSRRRDGTATVSCYGTAASAHSVTHLQINDLTSLRGTALDRYRPHLLSSGTQKDTKWTHIFERCVSEIDESGQASGGAIDCFNRVHNVVFCHISVGHFRVAVNVHQSMEHLRCKDGRRGGGG